MSYINDEKFKKFQLEARFINSGGCGIYALAVARYLMNQGYSQIRLVACCKMYHDPIEIQNNNHIIGNVPAHIVVKIDNYCIDSTGIIDFNSFSEFRKNLGDICVIIDYNDENLKSAINLIHDWNFKFNRKKYLPLIEELFEVSLEDIEF